MCFLVFQHYSKINLLPLSAVMFVQFYSDWMKYVLMFLRFIEKVNYPLPKY